MVCRAAGCFAGPILIDAAAALLGPFLGDLQSGCTGCSACFSLVAVASDCICSRPTMRMTLCHDGLPMVSLHVSNMLSVVCLSCVTSATRTSRVTLEPSVAYIVSCTACVL